MNILDLKSGSDIRGTAYGEAINLTCDVVKKIAVSYIAFLSAKYKLSTNSISIAIGRDSRVTGESLAQAFAEGVSSCGAKAYVFGICTTPSMYHCLIYKADIFTASVMVTASHHPFDKNGLKFFTKDGGLNSKDIQFLLEQSLKVNEIQANTQNIIFYNYLEEYSNWLKELICKNVGLQNNPLKGLHIVVDAGNGAGGFYAGILNDLGANTTGSQFLEPDGFFPNHAPNPENATAMNAIAQAVLANGADLGIIFDADCDRSAIVDNSGKEINRNRLIALISAILLENKKGITIVTDSVTSTGLTAFIESHGGKHLRFKRGYRNVIDECIRLNSLGIDAPLAIETSGHSALRDNHYMDDGMYLATLLIIKATQLVKESKVLGDVIANLQEPVEAEEIRLQIKSTNFKEVGNTAIAYVKEYFLNKENWSIAPDNHEGIRVYYHANDVQNSAWFLLRLSVHDPVMPLNLESNFENVLIHLKQVLKEVLLNIAELDCSSIQ